MKVSRTEIFIPERQRKDYGDLDDLADSFDDKGQIQPITVRPPFPDEETKERPYVLVAGGRRIAAATMAGIDQVAIYLREDVKDELMHGVLELHENLDRKDMTFQEIADAKKALFELRKQQDPDITAGEVAKEIGDNTSSFSRDVKAAELMEENPELRNSGSRKAVLRAGKLNQQLAARRRAQESAGDIEELIEKRLQLGDMLDWLPEQEEGSFDLLLADPPYGVEYFSSGQKISNAKEHLSHFDDSMEATVELYMASFPELVRVTRKTGWIVLFGNTDSVRIMQEIMGRICKTHTAFLRHNSKTKCTSSGDDGDCELVKPATVPWVWYRPNSRNSPRFPERTAKNVYELILPVNMGMANLAAPCDNLLIFDADYSEERIHVNQKPVPLCEELVRRFTFQGDRVADPCFGSGSSLIAATKLKRAIFGCELNEGVYNPALSRITAAYKPVEKPKEEVELEEGFASLGDLDE